MESPLPGLLVSRDTAKEAFLKLSVADLTKFCSSSKEVSRHICNEEFWKSKTRHDFPNLNLNSLPPQFETWHEFLIHRTELRRTLQSLYFRFLHLKAPSSELDLDEQVDLAPNLSVYGDEDFIVSTTHWDNNLNILINTPTEEDDLIIDDTDPDWLYRFLNFTDTFQIQHIILTNREEILVQISFGKPITFED